MIGPLVLAVLLVADFAVSNPGAGTSGGSVEDTTTIVETTIVEPTIVTTPTLPTLPPATPATPATTAPATLPARPQRPVTRPAQTPAPTRPPAAAPTPDVTPPPSTPLAPSPATPTMLMDRPSVEPGGVVTLTGEGCEPGAPVSVGVGDVAVGSIPGHDDGRFVAILTLPTFEPGRYDIHVDCGATFTAPIDVVVATSVRSPNSVLALFIFFVLMVLVLFRRRRIHHRAGSAGREDPDTAVR